MDCALERTNYLAREMMGYQLDIPRLTEDPGKPLANRFHGDSSPCMMRAGFLDPELRRDLIDLARDGLVSQSACPARQRAGAAR